MSLYEARYDIDGRTVTATVEAEDIGSANHLALETLGGYAPYATLVSIVRILQTVAN